MHSVRREAVKAVIESLILGKALTVTALGRAMNSEAMEKHCIKRVDRLMSNRHLMSERIGVYRALAHRILGTSRHPLILVDWSNINEREGLFLLRAATPLEGRSQTIYEEIHGISSKEKATTHKRFLNTLKKVLPKECSPILVTDAGFKTPWFKQVEAFGWDWVGRVRGNTGVQLFEEKAWKTCKSLYVQATARAKNVGCALLAKTNSHPCILMNMYLK
jgi:hypothetical protein